VQGVHKTNTLLSVDQAHESYHKGCIGPHSSKGINLGEKSKVCAIV
jgi:hypothetical protein